MERNGFDFYSNAVQVISGLYEITLHFRNQMPRVMEGEEAQAVAELVGTCSVRMSPQHAKAVAALLVSQIVAYEKHFGTKLSLEQRLEEMWNKYVREVDDDTDGA